MVLSLRRGHPYAALVLDVVVTREVGSLPGPLSIYYAACDELSRRYGSGADTESTFPEQFLAPVGFFLVARVENHLAGGVGLRTIGDPLNRQGEVKRLWVRPDLRRQGIAASLMKSLIQHAERENFDELFLETGEAQPEAIAFYSTSGWTRVERLPPDTFSYPDALKFYRDLRQ